MIFGILNRMLFWELVRVFLFSAIGLTGLFVIGGVIQQASQYGLSGAQIFRVIPLIVPSSLPYTIPATTLFAACVVYGRLSQDNEAVAIKAAGVDLLNVLKPAFAMGILAAGATAFFSYNLIPSTQRQLHEEFIKNPEETVYSVLKRERMFGSQNLRYVLHVRDVQDRRLLDVIVKRKSEKEEIAAGKPQYDFVARTREAQLKIDLVENTLTIDTNDKWVTSGSNVSGESLDNKPIVIPLPNDYRQDRLTDMTEGRSQLVDWPDLPERAGRFKARADEALKKQAAILAVPAGLTLTKLEQDDYARIGNVTPDVISYEPAKRVEQSVHYGEVAKYQTRLMRSMEAEYYTRPALAVAGLLFALIGCPVGMYANRADYLSIFVICFLPAMLIYFPILLSGGGMARDGKVPMIAGIWAANALFAVGSFVLSWRLIRR